jgi:drug/metabolite transporter (DMT)-like permease
VVCVFWALNVIVLKRLLVHLGPAAVSAGRYVIVTAIALAVAAARGGPWTIERRDLPRALLSGVLGVAVFQVLFMEGLQRTTAFASNLLQGTEPLGALVLLRLFLGARIRGRQWAGVLLAMAGAFLFFLDQASAGFHLAVGLGDLLSVTSAWVFAIYGIVSAPLFARYPGHTVMAVTMTVGSLALAVWAHADLVATDWASLGPAVWAGLLFSAALPLYVGVWVWNWAVMRKGLAHASLYIFVDILLSGFFAYLLLGERFGPSRLLGAVVILAGVYLARSGERTQGGGPPSGTGAS